ncbi:hypothetical protein [Acinetobacter larvae]|uniref:hypothetical protein n=1 Tax=Acinetobacter larvae TaxID=1789224 RepID=UPI0012FDB42E|nr:hypothetical protein [Acinetobacter larvae]
MSLTDTLAHSADLYPELQRDLDFLAQQYSVDITTQAAPDFSLTIQQLQHIAARL